MAEMTVVEAVAIINKRKMLAYVNGGKPVYRYYLTDSERDQIATLLGEQAAEIERLKCCGNCKWDEVGYCPSTAEVINDKCNRWEAMK